MSKIVVFLHHNNQTITKQSYSTLTAVQSIKSKFNVSEVIAVLLGNNTKKSADELKGYGITKVYYSEIPEVNQFKAKTFAKACLHVINVETADFFIAPASSAGKDFAPLVAQSINAGQASDIVAINDDKTFKRPLFAGNIFADVEIVTQKKVVTVRPSAFAPLVKYSEDAPEIIELKFEVGEDKVKITGFEISKNERSELSDAEIVVSGGRALQSAENFEKIIFPLADQLKAAVGASRAAVDSGYAPNDWQVGQTGKVVAPQLYIAVGISGAIQHLAGMKDSKFVVAINKDAEAPIFEVADYGLVGDLFDIVPKLTEALKNSK